MDQTFVISAGRKNIPKNPKVKYLPEIFVEKESNNNVRYRQEHKHSTPNYENPLKNVQDLGDSGISPGSECDDVSSLVEESSKTWESFISPFLKMRHFIEGRPSFIEETRALKWDLPTLVRGALLLVMFSSIGFSICIGNNALDQSLNGKFRSLKFGTEKKIMIMKKANRIIDYDIKDEAGNILGGKKASIQFAHNKRIETEKRVNKQAPELIRKVIKTVVSEPKPISSEKILVNPEKAPVKPEVNQLSILELSRKIEALSTLIKGEVESGESEVVMIEDEIEALKTRKRNLIKKLQQSNQVQPLNLQKKRSVESAGSKENVQEDKDVKKVEKKVKQPKTKVTNPLTESIEKPKQSGAKMLKNQKETPSTKSSEESKESNDVEEEPDYTDDPKFRSKDEA